MFDLFDIYHIIAKFYAQGIKSILAAKYDGWETPMFLENVVQIKANGKDA